MLKVQRDEESREVAAPAGELFDQSLLLHTYEPLSLSLTHLTV